MRLTTFLLSLFFSNSILAQPYIDKPFIQDYADKFEFNNVDNSNLLQVKSDRNQAVKILSSKGLLQPFEKKIVPDLQYRPMVDMDLISLDIYKNQFVYLTDKAVLSNAWAGKLYIEHGVKNAKNFLISNDFLTLVVGDAGLKLFQKSKEILSKSIANFNPIDLLFDKRNNRFLILSSNTIYQLDIQSKKLAVAYSGSNLTAMALLVDKIILGTSNGILTLHKKTFKVGVLNQKLPNTEITTVKNIKGQLWFGSTKGAFKLRADGKYDYYASKRWLVDDEVITISAGSENSVLILTKTGLSKINFVAMTLAEKAAHFQKIQRLRHIRYGLTGERNLATPGDVSTGVYQDTDNDGLWTSMYLAGELFRYAVTKSEDAKLNAYEAFEAMERLTGMTGLDGFPARTYERDGYEQGLGSNGFSEEWRKEWVKKNGRIWRLTEDEKWRWKSSTSSDESCGHFFVYALFAELAPDKEWRDRAIHQIKIEMDHIMENDWYLVDWNGKPTAWGKWNPTYVNSFPINVGDRRLNSTLILAFLQTAYHFTGDEKYKNAALKLIKKHGYDENANRPASIIGFVEGQDLSDGWNHSDDEMYFLTIPAFVNYSFLPEQQKKHFEAARSHWNIERSEKNPLWNFLYAITGGKDYDLDNSIWWLREFPMDLVLWNIDNSQRKDLVKIPPNFRNQTYSEVLPPDEVPVHLFNGAYHNNSKSNAAREDPPYLFLLPYWAGRYVDAISAAASNNYNQLTTDEKKEGFKSLFNGQNLDHWVGDKNSYVVENDKLKVRSAQGGDGTLYTVKEYADFIFRFEFQLTPGANNGLGIHAPLEGNAAYLGKEIQILDNTASIYAKLQPYQYHGSVYGVIPAKRGFLKPVGEWNSEEVMVRGDHIKITLNGTVILDKNIKQAAKNGTLDGQDHPGLKRNKGHIGFLGHGSELQIRNIRIKNLTGK